MVSKKKGEGAGAPKAFSTQSFSGLKTLQDMRRAAREEASDAARREEEARAAREAARAREAAQAEREFRFSEADLSDDSGMSDEEIFAATMDAMDSVDIYQKKFNAKETPKKTSQPESGHLTMSDDEREFAIFTQEMAISNVVRLAKPEKPARKVRNKRKYADARVLENAQVVSVDTSAPDADGGMVTDYVLPEVSVTQVVKGEDIVGDALREAGETAKDGRDTLTPGQRALLHDIRRYEARYGMLISLKLRGLTFHAAMSRLDEFVDACVGEGRPYALVICGKGLGSPGAPVIKEGVLAKFRGDARVVEYAPALDADGDFGSVYISLRLRRP